MKNKLDFLPNKLNKYSIRRFTVGTASILVGSTLLFGIGNEAHAAEEHQKSNTTENVADSNASEAPTKEEVPNNEATSEAPTKEEVPSNEATSETPTKEEVPSNEATSEALTKEEVPSNEATSEAPTKEEVPSNEATSEAPTKEEVPSNEATSEALSKEHSSDNSISNPEVNSEVINNSKQETDNDKSSTSNEDNYVTYAAPTTSTNTRSVDSPSGGSSDNSQAQKQGKNVNDSIKVNSVDIDKDYVEPNNGHSFSTSVSFEVDGKVNKGDYFTVDMPEYADFNGIADYKAANNKIYPTINDGEQVVANGVYDTETKKLVYTFTDYVNKKENIKGQFEIPQFIDRKNAKTSGDYDLIYNVADKTVTKPIEVVYNNYNEGHVIANASSLITKADLFNVGSHDYTQYIYVNPKSEDSYNTRLTIQGYQEDVNDSSTLLNPDYSNIEILDAKSSDNVTPSFYVNEKDLENVTDQYKIDQIGDKKAQIDFGHIDHPYIVKVTSKIDSNSSKDLRTRVIMENENAEGTTDFYAHDNTVERLGANGVARGDEKLYNLGDYVWEDTNKNGIQDDEERGIEGVEVSLTRPNGTIETTKTDSEGKYEFKDLPNGNYVINFKTPEGYTATKAYQGTNSEVDSNGLSTVGVIQDGDNWTLDSGFYKTTSKYSLGDYVWFDSNKDGYQDENEKGIQGVKVTLKDSEGNVLKTTETDENGKYRFDELDSGDYIVHFDKPEGLTQTSTNSGNDDAKDADGEEVHVTITDHDDFTIDNGYFEDSESTSESDSDSESTSESDSDSESTSESDSDSESTSESDSDSESTSESDSDSESTSESDSDSESTSESDSDSESTSESDSDSESTSESDSDSESTSESDSELPDTGQEDHRAGLIGSMLAAFGGITLLGRRRKKEEK
ncbi:SdrD B-like domain-containing protein [Staphylococcus epidermidis]|uniref:SdrD B-like domain-containing protein n=1 Tax=Staphylococcus epidermidis TaxID=1282 RepID=UPI0030C29EE1